MLAWIIAAVAEASDTSFWATVLQFKQAVMNVITFAGALGSAWAFCAPFRDGVKSLVGMGKQLTDVNDKLDKMDSRVAKVETNTADMGSVRESGLVAIALLNQKHKKDEIRLEAMGIAEFTAASDGKFGSVSREFCRMIGGSSDECLGWNWLNHVCPDEREKVESEWRRHVAYQIPFKMRVCWMSSDEEKKITDVSAGPIIQDGQPLATYYGVVHPVQEVHQ